MKYPFITGNLYSRRDVASALGLEMPSFGGDWATGYVRHLDDYIIFCNIGTPGRTGHDYANGWDGDRLVWYAKNGTHLRQPTVQQLINGGNEVYLFWREDNQAPFWFAGLAVAEQVYDTSPVQIRWHFSNG